MVTKMPAGKPNQINICPFCGFKDDRETALSYPSEFNFCYHTKPIDSIALPHQHQFCLSSNFDKCPIFQNEKIIRMPREYKGEVPKRRNSKTLATLALLLVFVLAGLFLARTTGIITLPFLPEQQTLTTLSPTQPLESSATITPIQATNTSSPQPEPSNTNTPVEPTSVTPHQLEVAFGSNPQFIIHRIQEGEGFILLASNYQTSVDAIKSVNYAITDSLLVNKVIVIPINTIDVSSLPAFSIYEIIASGDTIETIAGKLKINVDDFLRYNDLPKGYVPIVGEWLLIPH
jgi:LysM repeat protein